MGKFQSVVGKRGWQRIPDCDWNAAAVPGALQAYWQLEEREGKQIKRQQGFIITRIDDITDVAY